MTKSYRATLPPLITIATIAEEFFVEGLLMDPAPPSPSVFLDLCLIPDGDGVDPSSSDNLVLPYISRMLMEDDMDDKLFDQYSDDPALLQAQQPFAQIVSTISSGTNNDYTQPVGCAASLQGADRGNLEEANGLLPGANGDQSTLSSAFSKSVDVVGAFFKGIEEGSKFLPKDNGFRRDEVVDQMFRESGTGRGCKNRYDREEQLEEAVGRTSKRVLMMADPEKVAAHEMFDDMMLHGFKTCIKDMEKLRMDIDKEAEKKNSKGRSKAVDLRMLLIHCAQAVATDNHRSAGELLKEIKKHASLTGDATQRLAHCFARGLEARLAGSGSQLCQLLTSKRISAVDFLKAYKLYTADCCFNRVAFMFSTMTIMHAVAGKSRLHIVDYGMHYGLQWAGLLNLLANREGGPPEVKITAIGLLQPGFHSAGQVEETECRLSNCAREFGLPFKFYAIASKWEAVHVKDLNIDQDEVLVVNDLLSFRNLMDESVFFDSPSPRDAVLSNIRKMRPDVFIQGIGNSSYCNTFLSRFREALFYYSALFDMLDATVPRESEPRLVLEQDMMGQSVLNIIACQGADLVVRPEKYRQWQARNQRAGLRQLPLNPNIVKAVRDTVNKCHHKDFLVGEDGGWLLQGWMGRILFAHSTWVAEDTSSR